MKRDAGEQAGACIRRWQSAARDMLRCGLLLAIPGLAAWATGRHMIFPSLGPTAFLLVVRPGRDTSARHVIGGHLVGVVSGMIAYHFISRGVMTRPTPEAMSWDSLQLGLGAVVALMLTVGGMGAFRAQHAAACATALIIAMGELTRWSDGLLVMAGVVVMFAAYRLMPHLRVSRHNQLPRT